jgi:hypothetical protein
LNDTKPPVVLVWKFWFKGAAVAAGVLPPQAVSRMFGPRNPQQQLHGGRRIPVPLMHGLMVMAAISVAFIGYGRFQVRR